MASIYLPPIARKKKVDGHPRHDTSRVFADLQSNNLPGKTSYDAHYTGHTLNLSPQQQSMLTGHKPHPTNVTFLRQNPRFICEPVCYAKTNMESPVTYPAWWPDEVPDKPSKIPKHSFDSTSRTDYCPPPPTHDRITQYSSNLATQVGIIPQGSQTSGSRTPRVIEKISYEHQFNSRLNPSHPIRGRRHGSFIWKAFSDVGKPNRKHNKPVEYTYQEGESANAVTVECATKNSATGAKVLNNTSESINDVNSTSNGS